MVQYSRDKRHFPECWIYIFNGKYAAISMRIVNIKSFCRLKSVWNNVGSALNIVCEYFIPVHPESINVDLVSSVSTCLIQYEAYQRYAYPNQVTVHIVRKHETNNFALKDCRDLFEFYLLRLILYTYLTMSAWQDMGRAPMQFSRDNVVTSSGCWPPRSQLDEENAWWPRHYVNLCVDVTFMQRMYSRMILMTHTP